MKMIPLGAGGPPVSAIGLGCMGFSGAYGPADDGESIGTIRAALDAGVNFLDTGDFYGSGHNEMLVSEAIAGRRDEAFLAVKFGAMRSPSGAFTGFDGRPAAVKNFLAYTLRRLRTDHVDLYQPSRVDPNVPIEDTVGAVKEMIAAGYVRYLGVSEAGPQTIRRAHAVHKVAALQTEYSIASRGIESETLPLLDELGVGLVVYGVLSRGLLGGDVGVGRGVASSDFRSRAPRFQAENLVANLRLVGRLSALAGEAGLTPLALALGFVRTKAPNGVALIGTRRRSRVAEAVAGADTVLPPDLLAEVERAFPPGAFAGERYDQGGMAHVGR